ncbi:MAG: hypothetical protein F6J98_30910 [Moorea sp. SIO4G2]|nr:MULTISPECIES: hypothetical protein [unclassified Moorena]NEO14779.1 hypothetical protein [Moorena sp. SIO3E8]NEO64583.1 hypothetical protein [Moorena sp. SIO4G2]NEQ01177.1 hypothetical protein [Moorena sp. SIO3F7]
MHPPYSLLPTPYSLLPIPYSLLPTPYSLFPTPFAIEIIDYVSHSLLGTNLIDVAYRNKTKKNR